ncbi:MAG: hypothetical protein NT062_30610 [Proteobacteria bacterium]|nr:hypothetical protein [Pseudomonadota bacterium]
MNRLEVMFWARRICAARTAEPHVVLEIAPDASGEVAQAAFHAIARDAHPDLHRTTSTPDELELVTTAFSIVAASYHQFRTQRTATTRMSTMSTLPAGRASHATVVPPMTAVMGVLLPEKSTAPAGPPMEPRALVHYRKAEQALRRGDLTAAVLHLKMALGADPQSAFLRQAMKEVEATVSGAKKP